MRLVLLVFLLGSFSANALPTLPIGFYVEATPEERAEKKRQKELEKKEKRRQKEVDNFEKAFERAKKNWGKAKLERKRERDVEKERRSLYSKIERTKEYGSDDAFVADAQKRVDAFLATLLPKIKEAEVLERRSKIKKEVAEVEPTFFAERVAIESPGYCEGVLHSKLKEYSGVGNLYDPSDDRLHPYSDIRIVEFACRDPDFELRQKWIRAWRQSLSNAFGLTQKENADYMNFVAKLARTRAKAIDAAAAQGKSFNSRNEKDITKDRCEALPLMKSGTFEQQVNRLLERIALRCMRQGTIGKAGNAAHQYHMPFWDIDIENGITSELAKAGLYTHLLTGGSSAFDGSTDFTDYATSLFVSLDRKAFEEQLAKSGLDEWASLAARIYYRKSEKTFLLFGEGLAKASKQNPAMQKMFLESPQKSIARWKKDSAKHKELMNFVLALEDKMGKDAGGMKGCGKAMAPLIKKWVKRAFKKKPNISLEEIKVSDFEGYQVAYGATLCARNDVDSPGLDIPFAYYLNRASPVRGPMSAAYQGIIDAYNNARKSKRSGGFSTERGQRQRGESAVSGLMPSASKVLAPNIRGSVHNELDEMTPDSLMRGVVRSVKKRKGNVKIVFKTERWKQPVYNCVDTNKISAIRRDGTIAYQSKCTQTGTRDASSTNAPVEIPAWAAEGIRPGAMLYYAVYPNSSVEGRGYPIEVYQSKRSKKRVAAFGFKIR